MYSFNRKRICPPKMVVDRLKVNNNSFDNELNIDGYMGFNNILYEVNFLTLLSLKKKRNSYNVIFISNGYLNNKKKFL